MLSPGPEGKNTPAPRGWGLQGWPRLVAEGLGAAAVSTMIAWPFFALVPVAPLAVVFLVGVLFVGVRRGTLGAIIASGISFMAYNFFFTMPFYSLWVSKYESIVALMVFTISVMFTGSLAGRLKRQVEFMRVSEARTETTEKLRAALLNSVSHDLRTPLATVIGALTAMADGTLPPAQNTALTETALDEARRLDRFVGNLLNMTRLGHGKLLAQREVTRLADAVGRVRTYLARPLAHFRLDLDLPDDLPPALIDPVLIGQALTNLVENATKYVPEGTIINITGHLKGASVNLTVEDEGPGFPRAERRRVFEMFFRAVTGDGAPAGTGLGLAIAKGMVEANDGTIAASTLSSGQVPPSA